MSYPYISSFTALLIASGIHISLPPNFNIIDDLIENMKKQYDTLVKQYVSHFHASLGYTNKWTNVLDDNVIWKEYWNMFESFFVQRPH